MKFLARYPSYRETGTTWLGQIPVRWESIRFKWVVETLESGSREEGGGNQLDEGVFSIGGEHIGWRGELFLEPPKYISDNYYETLKHGKIREQDVLLVKDGATIGKTAIITSKPFEKCAINEHVYILRSGKRIIPKLLFYFLQSKIVQEQIYLVITGSAQPGLNSKFIDSVIISLPPLSEQEAIANYLGRATARIDALIAKKKRLLELLAEKRVALITRAVTRGLDPNLPMKDSGVEWLGEIPKHWEVKKIKYIAQINPSLTNNDPLSDDTEITFLPMEDIENGSINPQKTKKYADVRQGFTYFCEGDILVAKITPCFENGKGSIAQGLKNRVGFGTTELHIIRPSQKDFNKISIFPHEVNNIYEGW